MIETLTRLVDNPTVSGILLALVAAAIGMWLAASWWVYSDASRRTESELARFMAVGWMIVSTPVLLPLSLGIYTLLRPQTTLGEIRTRRLALELAPFVAEQLGCGACGAASDPGWRRCPTCTEWLQAPCAHCEAWSDIELDFCPYCGSETLDFPRVAPLPREVLAPVGRMVDSPGLTALVEDGVAAASLASSDAGTPSEAATARIPVATGSGRDGRDARDARVSREARAAREAREARERTTPGARRVRRGGSHQAGGRLARTTP
jgi:hypothetical protein